MKENFLSLFKDALEIESDVNLDNQFRDYAEWDSLSRLSLIAMLDTEYGIQIENEQFASMKRVSDIYDYVCANSRKV